MAQRTVMEVMMEGVRLEAEQRELLRKSITGTLTAEEETRKAQLEGYLLGLVQEAQALGVGTGYDGTAEFVNEEEDELEGDLLDDDSLTEEPRRGGDPFGGSRFW